MCIDGEGISPQTKQKNARGCLWADTVKLHQLSLSVLVTRPMQMIQAQFPILDVYFFQDLFDPCSLDVGQSPTTQGLDDIH
jgi:hypothetical protein